MLDTILIIDENAEQCDIAKEIITDRLKYNTLTAFNHQEIMDLVLPFNSVVNLVLIDMRVSGLDILQIIRAIKLDRPEIPIIVLTEYGDCKRAIEAIEAGANDFLSKPFVAERLNLSMASALRIYHLCNMVQKLEKQISAKDAISDSDNVLPLPQGISPVGNDGKLKKLRALEEDAIRFALNIYGGSMSKAARSLGIGRSTLYRKVSEIERHQKKGNYNNSNLQIGHAMPAPFNKRRIETIR